MAIGRLTAQAVRGATRTTSIARPNLIRTYASDAAVKPPVALYGLDGTYATALYTAAAKTSVLDPTAKSLAALASVVKKDSKLPAILSAPMLTDSDKSQIVAELTKHTGGSSAPPVVKNFLETLAENNRLGVLPGVLDKFEQLISAHKGEVEVTVTSAQQLDGRVLKQLETAVSKSEYVGQGKKLKVVAKVNPDIKGGLIVEIGDRTIDLSVASKLSKMNKLLTDQL